MKHLRNAQMLPSAKHQSSRPQRKGTHILFPRPAQNHLVGKRFAEAKDRRKLRDRINKSPNNTFLDDSYSCTRKKGRRAQVTSLSLAGLRQWALGSTSLPRRGRGCGCGEAPSWPRHLPTAGPGCSPPQALCGPWVALPPSASEPTWVLGIRACKDPA